MGKTIIKNPRMNFAYRAEFIDNEGVLLLSEKNKGLLTGELYIKILNEVKKKSCPVDELIRRLDGVATEFEIYHALELLRSKGYIVEDSPCLPDEVSAFWNSHGIYANVIVDKLPRNPVCLEAVKPMETGVFRDVFQDMGFKVTDQKGDAALVIVITDDYDRKELQEMNRWAIDTGRPWMIVKPVGVEFWIGPVFVPGKTGCWQCLKQRLDINRPVNTVYKQVKNTAFSPHLPVAAIDPVFKTAAALAAVETAKLIYYGNNENIIGKVVSFDTHHFKTEHHSLTRRPQCESCREKDFEIPHPAVVRLTPQNQSCVETGSGYRERPPEETIEAYRHHISPITGMVSKLEPYFPMNGAPVFNYSSGANMAFMSKSFHWLNNHIRAGNGGKGSNDLQARVGALCEGIERYGLCYHGDEFTISSTLAELGVDGIHPNTCMNFSEKQYREREDYNRSGIKAYMMTPVPFDPDRPVPWTPVYSINQSRFKYLPTGFCFAQFPFENDTQAFSYPDSNGCAAGNSVEEAMLQGFLELVERDAVAIWWYNRLKARCVDLESFDCPYFATLAAYYASIGRSLYVLDITSDLNIPTFAAVSHFPDRSKPDVVFGFGAHVDAAIGIERALTELNQVLPAACLSQGSRQYRTKDKPFLSWLKTATLENQPYLVPADTPGAKRATDYPRLCPATICDSLWYCIGQAEQQGLETLVCDLTRMDMDLKVVRVIVPGMRHFWQRFAPGRLYEIPVTLGLRETPLVEEEMNPIGLFL